MRRVVSLFLPTWSTDRLRRKAGKPPPEGWPPLVTALPDHGRRVLASVDAAARSLGIQPGMTATRALHEPANIDGGGLQRLAVDTGEQPLDECLSALIGARRRSGGVRGHSRHRGGSARGRPAVSHVRAPRPR